MPERCAGCGLDWSSISPGDAEVAVRSFPRRWRAALGAFGEDEDADALVRRRPEPSSWSAIEYACHLRDVLELYEGHVRSALVEDRPMIASADVEASAEERRYREQDLTTVLDELADRCGRLASTLDGVAADDWKRSAVRDGEEISVLWMARHAVHEGSHHLRDAERVVNAVRGRP